MVAERKLLLFYAFAGPIHLSLPVSGREPGGEVLRLPRQTSPLPALLSETKRGEQIDTTL